MVGRLIDRWEYTWAEIWEPLALTPSAPDDLYNEFYRTALDKLRKTPTYEELSLVTSEPEYATAAFRAIQGKDFKAEGYVVQFFEDSYEALEEFGIGDLQSSYQSLVVAFLGKYNLRYRLVQPFNLRVQLPWLYADVYATLRLLNEKDEYLSDLLEDFEDAFDLFVRTRRRTDFSSSIAKASNYAEGVAAHAAGVDGRAMGDLVDLLQIWPHRSVQQSIKSLYGFCSDYPGIRHAGNRNGRLRRLNVKDTVLISALLMAFSGYIHEQVDVAKILR